MFGRMTSTICIWDSLAQYETLQGKDMRSGIWLGKVIRLSWKYGLELWTVRNQLVHGSVTGVSLMEHKRVVTLITALYRELPLMVPQSTTIVFGLTKEEMMALSYHSQLAWLGHVKYVYPRQFTDIESSIAGSQQSRLEIEAVNLQQTGTKTQ